MGEFKLLLSDLETLTQKKDQLGNPVTSKVQAIAINVSNIPSMDASALLTIVEMVETYHHRNIRVCFIQVSDEIRQSFHLAGLEKLVGPENFFETNHGAIRYLEANVIIHDPNRQAYESFEANKSPLSSHDTSPEITPMSSRRGSAISPSLQITKLASPMSLTGSRGSSRGGGSPAVIAGSNVPGLSVEPILHAETEAEDDYFQEDDLHGLENKEITKSAESIAKGISSTETTPNLRKKDDDEFFEITP